MILKRNISVSAVFPNSKASCHALFQNLSDLVWTIKAKRIFPGSTIADFHSLVLDRIFFYGLAILTQKIINFIDDCEVTFISSIGLSSKAFANCLNTFG